jgi:hypothetical protein
VYSSKFILDERLSEDRLSAPQIRRNLEEVIVSLYIPLKVLGMRQHLMTSTFYSFRISVLKLLVCTGFECLIALTVLIIKIPLLLFLMFPFNLVEIFFY